MTDLDRLTISLAEQLIARPSVSPHDDGCQAIMTRHLEAMGFTVETMPHGEVSNFWAVRAGTSATPILAFAGHTDVVPPGPLHEWRTDPFEPVVADDVLIGRGAADMKGSLAAMITGIQRFLETHQTYRGTIALLITSDEEADAIDGTAKVIDQLNARGTHIDWCVVGEPSSTDRVGDVIRVGRRGSLYAELTVLGQQGHVAYPDDAENPIHLAMLALAALTDEVWDQGNEFFPPTSMQISNLNAGTGARNVIPGNLKALFSFRFGTASSEESLQRRTAQILDSFDLNYELSWSLSGQPFITTDGELIPAMQESLRSTLGIEPELSTSGGTSDGRFIAPLGTEVVELGPTNATIHKVNENVSTAQLLALSRVYADVLERLLVKH